MRGGCISPAFPIPSTPGRDKISAALSCPSFPVVGRTRSWRTRSRRPRAFEEDRTDPPVRSLISRIESRVPRDDWKRWIRRSRHGFFTFEAFLYVDGCYGAGAILSRAVSRRRGSGAPPRGGEGAKGSRSSESWHVGRDENGKSKGGTRCGGGGGGGGKGRSVGRRFHFVSLPACGGAIAAALCQTVTLSRHPFYYLARGCPAPLSTRALCAPCAGTTWIKPRVA